MKKTAAVCLALALGVATAPACLDRKCFEDADCEAPQRCRADGLCAFECSEDSDCSAGFGCRQHRCEPQTHLPIVCPPEMASVADTFCADRYEASHPDATGESQGSDDSIARSVPGVLPWQVDSNAAALAACQAAGKRLCSPDEWHLACRGPEDTAYVYGELYEPATCNGIDAFGRTDFHLAPTGSFPGCTNAWGLFDLTGNLWEHVAGGADTTVRGGAFNCGDSAKLHKCDFVPGTWKPSARGFRCCLTPAAEGADAGSPAADAGANAGIDDAGTDDAGIDGGGIADAGTSEDAGAPGDGGCRPEMAQVGGFCIDRWEASHQDATASAQGTAPTPRSQPGVLPWWPVSTAEARAACELAGKRLCLSAEWAGSCQGPSGSVYSYGDEYRASACNGIDAFCSCGSASCGALPDCPYPHCYNRQPDGTAGGCGAAFHVVPTGSFPDCTSPEGVFDLNGNLWELVDPGPDAGTVDHARGGAYNCADSEALHRCDLEVTWNPPARGFRCCAALQ